MKAVLELDLAKVQVVAAPPELVSQRTSEAVLGIHKSAYLEALHRYAAAGGEVMRLGRLRLVRRVDFVAWLTKGAVVDTSADPTDDLAAELGLRLAR